MAIRQLVLLYIVKILDPTAMGVFEAALIVGGLLDVLVDAGVGQAVIQRKELSAGFISTVFWLQFGISVLLGGAAYLLAVPLSVMLGAEDAAPLLRILAWSFPLLALGSIHARLLMRDLRFGGVALGDFVNSLTYGVVVLVFLHRYPGPELLVWALVGSYGARSLILWAAQRAWTPSFTFQMKYIREVSSFSLNLLGSSVGTYALQRLDRILIAHFGGEAALGIYGFAHRMILRPARMLAPIVSGVLLPALARVQDDLGVMRRLYSRGLGGIVLAVFPALVGIALIVPSLVLVVDNPNWAAARWVIAALLPYALLFTVLSSVGSVFVSLKRTDLMLRVNIGTSAACLVVQGVLVLAFRGHEGAELGAILAGGASVTMLLLSPWVWRTALNLMDMSLLDALRPLVSTMLATLGMVVAVMGGHALLGTSLGPIPSLLAEIAIGVLSYGVLIWWLQPPALVDLLAFLGLRKGPSRNLSD